jgi:cytochrome d ubiquinol oxidase subunit II
VVAVLAGGAILFPSLALLLRLTLMGRLQGGEGGAAAPAIRRGAGARPALLARLAVACLIVGFGLLNVADARWAHAVGVASLFAFIVTAFAAIVPATLGRDEAG